MTDRKQDDALNDAVDAALAGGSDAPSTGDPEADALARLASRLRGMPSPVGPRHGFFDGETRGLPSRGTGC
jgi:hypothetical protein